MSVSRVTLPSTHEKRERILQCAARIFRDKGYVGATLSEIAAEVGTLAGSLYYYFASKDVLANEVLRRAMHHTFSHVEGALENGGHAQGPRDRILIAATSHLEAILDDNIFVGAYRSIHQQMPDGIDDQTRGVLEDYDIVWNGLIGAAQESGDLRMNLDRDMFRLVIFGAITWCMEWYKAGESQTPREIAEYMIGICFDGGK